MIPVCEIAKLYERYPQQRDLWHDLALYDKHGFVFGGEDFLLMGRAVDRTADWSLITDPAVVFPTPDAWFIHAFAGNVARILEYRPYPLPWVGWARRWRRINWYETERALQRAERMISFVTPPRPMKDSIKGFGGGKTPKAEKVKIPKAEPIVIPQAPQQTFEMPKVATAAEIAAAMPTAVEADPIPPPPSTSPIEATEAADEELRKQSKRRGMTSSVIAGEQTRDYTNTATGTGSILG